MISFAATPQAKEAQQARTYTDPSAGAPPSRRSGANAPYIDKDHWNRVFTEPDYFDAIAKQKGMAEGAKVSLHGDDYVYRQAMMGYLSATRNVPLDDMRSIFDAEKDGFAQKVLGKQTASAREMFDWHKAKYERDNEKQAAARQIMDGVIQRSLQDALSGGDTPFVESVAKDIDAASEYFDDEEKSRLWEKAEELDMKIRAVQDRFAPEARFIFDALQQYSGQKAGFGAPDMRELAGRFASLPDNQRKAIYELVGGFASITKTDKGFFYQLAESLGRGTTDITERVPRNFREQTLRGQLRLLESDQPVFRATGVGGAEFSAAGSTPIFGATQGQMLTPEEREQAIAKIQADLGVLKVERELRDLAERVVDPIKMTGVLPEIIEEGLYGAARSIPYTAAAAVPFAGVPAVAAALFSSNYDNIMLEYPDIDPDKAALIAAISAPIEAGLERMKVNTIMGRMPFFGRWVRRFQHPNQRNIVRIAIGGAGIMAEQNAQEILQNATFPFVQTLAAALDEDMPDYDWGERVKGMPRELMVQFVALLPLSLMGIGALSYREISRGEAYLRSKDNLERAGYSEEQIDRITGAATADEAQSILREEAKKRDPEKVKAAAQRIVDEAVALREKANPAALPRLEKQGADYVVLSPDGKELARTTDQTAAEQALVSARRETVQREMRDVHTGINEAVEFIQKVNEARQRGADVAEVIREFTGRTLFTDYEANPSQQNLNVLFETARVFGGDPKEPEDLKMFPVIGSNQGALREGIWRSIIRINDGADGVIVMREFAQDNLKRAVAEGRVTMDWVRQQLNDILPQIESDRIQRRLRTETDTDVIEAFSDVAVAYFRGQIREEQIPEGLRGFFRRLAIMTRDIFRRAYNLARLRAEGKLDRDFEALLAEAVGVDQQALVDRARERTEQEVRGADGLTDEERAALQAELQAEMEQDAAEAAGEGGIDILDAVREAGGLPSKTSKKVYQYSGELQRIREAQKGGNAIGVKGTFNLFRKNAPDLDALIKDLQTMGFSQIETPSDLFEMIERRIATGRPIYGYEARAAAQAVENYSIAVTPQQDADYLAAVERGDMETAQRMVDEAAKAAGYTFGPVWHGTRKEFTRFFGQPTYFSESEQFARYTVAGKQGRVIKAYLRGNLFDPQNPAHRQQASEIEKLYGRLPENPTYQYFHAAVQNWLQENGWDGHYEQESTTSRYRSLVVFDPMANAKSADPVTYDAQGNVIPLSQRFDPTTPNINYSIGSRAQPDAERNVVTLPDVTISGPANYSIAAWHGSPAEFDEFDLEKLGTGEGAQAYGWGLYFAQNRKVADDYRVRLAYNPDEQRINGKQINDEYKAIEQKAVRDGNQWMYSVLDGLERLMMHETVESVLVYGRENQWDDKAIRYFQTANYETFGNMYEVSLDADPEELLDWDKPFTEQSDTVKAALGRYAAGDDPVLKELFVDDVPTAYMGFTPTSKGAQIYGTLMRRGEYPDIEQIATPEELSKGLLAEGIKGIRYLDQGSRFGKYIVVHLTRFQGKLGSFTAQTNKYSYKEPVVNKGIYVVESQDPNTPVHGPFEDVQSAETKASELNDEAGITYNYVIFDDSLIKILTRNGEQISVEQAAQETSNYSISTQSEIDRVQAAMGALDRSPLSRIKIYEKMQERFLRVMADNLETLAAMQGGDLAQVRRTQILQALGELDGIISALPAEIRSKIGGYTQLAKVDPMDVFKGDQKVSEVRGMSGAIISAWMREGLNIGEAQKKTELPAGYRAERNLDPTRADRAIADVFIQRINRINEVLENFLRDEYNDAAVELFKRAKPQRSGAGEKPKGKLGADVHELFNTLKEATEWSSEEAQAWADGQWARIESGELSPYEEAHASLAAQVVPLFADWANADSTQRAAAVTMGKDILDRAYKGERNRIIAQRTKRGYDRTDLSDDAGVASSDDKARQTALKKENSLPSKFESGMLNLLNFDQVLRYIFGNDSKVAREISDRQRKADNAKSDDIAALSDQWDTFLTALGGGQMEGQQLLFDLSRMNDQIDGVPYSQNQLIAITMMWMQPKGRQHMEGFLDEDGQPVGKWHYNQDFVNKAEKLLRPEAKAIRQYLLRKYDEEYEAINKVYRKVYGLNLPKNQFYSPLVVESINAPEQGGIDPVTGAVFSAGATSPSALRSRGGAIAQPVFRDAVQTYFGHMLQMAHWKAYAEFNSEVSALLGHRDTRNVVKGKAGEQAATVLNNWMDYFRQGGNKDAANHLALNQWINRITGNFAAISLFGRLSTLALQVTQLGAASAKMPVGAYLSRFGKLMSGRLKWTTALDSDYIQRRIKDMPPAVALAMQGLRAEKPSAIRNAARWLGQHLSSFDGFFTAGTYAIVYDYQLSQARQNGMGGQEAADYAREATERIVDEIAQPTRAGARSIYELNSTNPVARAVWAFSSESRKNMGFLLYNLAKGTNREYDKALTYVLLLNGLVGIVIRNAFRDMRDDDDDEIFDEKNWGWKRLAAQFISDPIYGIPVVGETAETAIYAALKIYRPTGPVFDVTGGVPAVKRLAYDHPMALLEGEAEFRDIVADVNRILAAAGLFNSTIAGAASISNLGKDVFEIGDNALGDE